jgi:dephospho-CoA kinase
MLVVGLTGGIGSGKSSFAALLAERGAQVIDADAYGHEALRPGEPSWHSVVDQFGDEVLTPGTMEIDRKVLADVVFSDSEKLAALNAIIHPVIFSRIADALERLSRTEEVVVVDAALIIETGVYKSLDALIVVRSDDRIRRERLAERGMTLSDIQARIAAQAPVEVLEQRADIVVDNDGTLEELGAEADRVWTELESFATR